MSWTIEHSKDADKFLNKNQQHREGIRAEIIKFLQKLKGEVVSIDVKKLSGN